MKRRVFLGAVAAGVVAPAALVAKAAPRVFAAKNVRLFVNGQERKGFAGDEIRYEYTPEELEHSALLTRSTYDRQRQFSHAEAQAFVQAQLDWIAERLG